MIAHKKSSFLKMLVWSPYILLDRAIFLCAFLEKIKKKGAPKSQGSDQPWLFGQPRRGGKSDRTITQEGFA
jgi:hypothetical protein